MPGESHARDLYWRATLATANPRTLECAALAKITAELDAARSRKTTEFPRYVAALSRNLSLWTQFAGDAAHDGNGLPAALRREIIRLATFVRAHTFRLHSRDSIADDSVLIDINRNVLAGLRAGAPGGAAT